MASGSAGLPVLEFNARSIDEEHLFESFHNTTAPLFDTYPGSSIEVPRYEATDYLVDDLIVSRLRYDALTMRRVAAHVRPNETDWITLQVYRRGGLSGHCGDTSLTIDTATVGMLDLSHTFAAYSEPSDVIWVCFPRDRLQDAESLAPGSEMPAWSRNSERGRALAASVQDLWGRLAHADVNDGGDLAAEVTESVNRALHPGDYTPTDRSQRRTMKDYIAANLDDLVLDADRVRTAFHCSRSAMYRIFQDDGGVAHHIREMRLVRCADELTRHASADWRISEIATNWGFENPSHFHRIFNEKFGVSPSTMRASFGQQAHRSVEDPRVCEMISEFHNWAS